uniref:Uncharacterized protein n=1 Tax=Romanomermis culicivorax TaxID=13658 RepID=A0A915L0B2_ROMCU
MHAVWSVNLAKKYQHLPWALLNELFNIGVLTAADVMLAAPVSLRLLGPDITRRALKFITNCTIQASPNEEFLLDAL